MNKNRNTVGKSNKQRGKGQPRKDSKDKRVNFDNTRVSKFKADEEKALRDPDNDTIWYKRNPELMAAASQIAVSNVQGMLIPQWETETGVQNAVPGVMAISYAESLGSRSPSGNQAIKQAMEARYSYVVHANSRNQSYQAPDLMILTYAGMEVFSAIAVGIRAYGVMRKYEQQNLYTPDVLLQAMGFDPKDLRNNYSHMWFDLNSLIAQSRQIWIPNDMPLIERRFWMNSHIYYDAESSKAQFYLYVPCTFYQYDATTETSGSSLQAVSDSYWDPGFTSTKWSSYLEMVQNMINALLNDSDRGLIFGDILKAYGADRIYRLNEITSDYTVEYVYDKAVLSQMENATFCHSKASSITQDVNAGTLMMNHSDIIDNSLKHGPARHVLLNFHTQGQPTMDEIIEATRMLAAGQIDTIIGEGSTTHLGGLQPYACQTEYAYDALVYTITKGAAGTVQVGAMDMVQAMQNSQSIAPANFYAWAAFDWAPHIYFNANKKTWSSSVGNAMWEPNYVMADYENYVILDMDTLKRIHDAAVTSLFGVPIDIK